MEELSDAEFGQFIRAYAAFVETGIEPDFSDRSLRIMWKTVRAFDQMNSQKYAKTSEVRQEAGRKGAEKRWNLQQQNMANGSKNSNCHFANSKNALSVSDSVSDSVVVVDTTAATVPTSTPRTDSDLAQIVQHFQQVIGDFPRSALDKLRRYQETFPTEVICKAFDEAAENGVRKWRYVDGILKGWQADGVRTLGDVEARREARMKPDQQQERKLEMLT